MSPSAIALAPSPDQGFAFHRSTNPELWRTTVPLIVRLRCGRHKGLISTWLAIHWLTILHSAREGAAFGVREIAQEAGVGRNELAGPSGHIQRLVALGLLQIVGYQTVRRGLRPCPTYHIDLPDLERQSVEAIQELLRARGLPAPPRPAPDPCQLALFDDDAPGAPPAAHGDAHAPAGRGASHADGPAPAPLTRPPGAGTAARCPAPGGPRAALPEHGTAALAAQPRHPAPAPAAHPNGTAAHPNGTDQRSAATPTVPGGTVTAPNRDVERETERRREGERAPAPDSLLALATAAARSALLELIQQLPPHVAGDAGAAPRTPAPPDGETPLPAAVLDLWAADRPTVLQRDRFQLELLAATADAASGGHGAYWLGRAILMAEACLEPRGQRPSIAYLRTLLRRWQREGSWGSDRAEGEAEEPAPAARAAPTAHDDPPAVRAYRLAFGRAPQTSPEDALHISGHPLSISR